jgi:hypothetical protein
LRTRENNERIARLENNQRTNSQAIDELINFPAPSRPVQNIHQMRDRLDVYDSLLNEIETYQAETDHLVQNIRYIDGLLR